MEMTSDEREIIQRYVCVLIGVESVSELKRAQKRTYSMTFAKVVHAVMRNIDSYGEDGMGDKPETMNRIAYWVQHLNPEHFVEEDKED